MPKKIGIGWLRPAYMGQVVANRDCITDRSNEFQKLKKIQDDSEYSDAAEEPDKTSATDEKVEEPKTSSAAYNCTAADKCASPIP